MEKIVLSCCLDQEPFVIFGHANILQSVFDAETKTPPPFAFVSPSRHETALCANGLYGHSDERFGDELENIIVHALLSSVTSTNRK
jgi:hypothetical protein